MARGVFLDSRMLFSSGIGRYLRSILTEYSRDDRGKLFSKILCNTIEQEDWIRDRFPDAVIIRREWGIYSGSEMLHLPVLTKGCSLAWSPHFNYPIVSANRKIVTVHDLIPLVFPEYRNSLAKKVYALLMLKLFFKSIDEIITVSSFSKNEIARLTNFNPDRVKVIPNGVESRWFDLNHIGGDYLLFIGNIKPHKNLDRLIEGFLKSINKHSLDLIIVGRGDGLITSAFEQIEKKANSCRGRVTFAGEVTDEKLKELICGAKALIFPSLYEGFGLPNLEAMAVGCPVVTSTAQSVVEVCGDEFDGTNGNVLYFDPFDSSSISEAILRLTRYSRVELNRMTGNARSRARLFSWEKAANKTFHVLERNLK